MKLKAFTIVDLIVGMLISSIIVAVGIEGMLSLNGVLNRNKLSQETLFNESSIRNTFIHDCEKADSVKEESGKLIVYSKHSSLEWRNEGNYVLRQIGEHIDTMNVRGNLLITDRENDLVKSVHFKASNDWSFDYVKSYKSSKLNQRNGNKPG